MNNELELCAKSRKSSDHCRLSPGCKGWGCRLLATSIEELPTTEKERAVLFSRVYREAKKKGVIECPFFNSLQIDRFLKTLEELQSFSADFQKKMSKNVSFAQNKQIVFH